MKFLLLLALAGLCLWWWRNGRSDSIRPDAPPPKAQTMLACAWCQVHVPASDALAGQRGHYCCAQHRQQAEP